MTYYLEGKKMLSFRRNFDAAGGTHDNENVAQTSCLQAGSPMSLTFGQWILAACK
jgi:hypothetical protein